MKGKSTFHQKAFKAALATTVATGAMVTVMPSFGQANENDFKDLDKSQYYYADVLNLMARNVVQGFPDGTYKPHRVLTRGQAAKILAGKLKLDMKNVSNPEFSDVKETDEYYGAIAALANALIISGYADNTFGEAKTLTRSQMAKMIAIGFNLSAKKHVNSSFTDVKENDAFSGYVHALIENKVTKGTSKTTFSPRDFVTRGQMASFIVRSEQAVVNMDVDVSEEIHAVIKGFTANAIVLSTGTFSIPADLKTVLVAENMEALTGAVLTYSIASDETVKLHSVELKANGTSAKKVVFDGKGSVFPGNFIVSGDYTTVQNITIRGNLEIGEGVKNDFLGKEMTVEGSTNISDKMVEKELTQASSDKVYKSLAFSVPVRAATSTVAANKAGATIVFVNSKIGLVNWMKQFSSIQLLRTTKVGRVIVSIHANALIGKDVVVPEVLLKGDAGFFIEGEGKIEILNVESPSAKITLGGQTTIGNLVVPAGSKVADIIQDYEKVKKYILKINGVSNVVVKPVTPPSYQPDIPNVAPPTPPIIVAPIVTTSKVYNGNNTAEVSVGALSGVRPGDTVTVSATATYDNANVGTTKTITVVYTLGGADASKYITPANEVLITGEIKAAVLTLDTQPVVANKVYDGSTAATVTLQPTLTGVIGSDVVTVNATGVFADVNVGNSKNVTMAYTLGGGAGVNYSLAPTTVTADITAKQLTMKSITYMHKVYDGTDSATITNVGLSGVLEPDEVTASAIGRYHNADAGNGKSVDVVYSLNGAQAANYIKPGDATLTSGSIEAAPVTGISTITGTAKVGEQLTAGTTLTPTDATVSYQWEIASTSNGTFATISGATDNAYTPVAEDAKKFIRVVATGIGNYAGTAISDPTTAVTSALDVIPQDILDGGTFYIGGSGTKTNVIGVNDVKLTFYYHSQDHKYSDRLQIVGLDYSTHKISVTTNDAPGKVGLRADVTKGQAGIGNYLPDFWSVGQNKGKQPQFTITFEDEYGNKVTTGTFTVQDIDGGVLKP